MYFHGNQHPWAIKHPFISLYSKYQSPKFICHPVMKSPVFPSLDDIYCMKMRIRDAAHVHLLKGIFPCDCLSKLR